VMPQIFTNTLVTLPPGPFSPGDGFPAAGDPQPRRAATAAAGSSAVTSHSPTSAAW
jgi:hypothetical protein